MVRPRSTLVSVAAACAASTAAAIEPAYIEFSETQMGLYAQFLGTVALGAGLQEGSGTMLGDGLILTAAHVISAPLSTHRIAVNGYTIEFTERPYQFVAAQGSNHALAIGGPDRRAFVPGSGATAFAEINAFVRLDYMTGPDVALAAIDYSTLQKESFYGFGGALGSGGVLKAVNMNPDPSVTVGPTQKAIFSGYSYLPVGSPPDALSNGLPNGGSLMAALAILQPKPMLVRPDATERSPTPPATWQWVQQRSTWQAVLNTPVATLERPDGQPFQVYLPERAMLGTPAHGDSGGGLFATDEFGLQPMRLIGVTSSARNTFGTTKEGDSFDTWVDIDHSMEWITGARAALNMVNQVPTGLSRFHPIFADATWPTASGSLYQFHLPANYDRGWVAGLAGGLSEFQVTSAGVGIIGLDLGQTSGMTFESFNVGLGQWENLAYTDLGNGQVLFDNAETDIRIGHLTRDSAGTSVIGMQFARLPSTQRSLSGLAATPFDVAFEWTTDYVPTPVPEPSSSSMVLLGLVFISMVAWRSRRRSEPFPPATTGLTLYRTTHRRAEWAHGDHNALCRVNRREWVAVPG